MGRVYIEDVTSIALLYNYEATHSDSMMLPHNMVQEYAQMIDTNLDTMGSKFDGVYPLDYSKLIYFNTQDENGNWYSILKPGVDVEMAKDFYIYRRKTGFDLEMASKMPNALEILNIELIEGKMQKLEHDRQKHLSLVLPKAAGEGISNLKV